MINNITIIHTSPVEQEMLYILLMYSHSHKADTLQLLKYFSPLWIIVIFLSAVWTLILMAPIHSICEPCSDGDDNAFLFFLSAVFFPQQTA